MHQLLRRGPVVLALVGLAALSAACRGGSGDDAPTREVTVLVDSTATRTAVPPEPGSRPTSTPAPALGLQSFRYTVNLSFIVDTPGDVPDDTAINGTIEGEFAAPDSHAFQQRFEVGGITGSDSTVLIDDDAWVRNGEGPWEAVPRSDPDVQTSLNLTSADPDFLGLDEDFVEGIAVFDSTEDQVDGRAARRYEFLQDDIETLSRLLGNDLLGGSPLEDAQNFEFRVWLDDATGSLLRAEMSATLPPDALGSQSNIEIPDNALVRFRLAVNITDVDDPSIVIEPPI